MGKKVGWRIYRWLKKLQEPDAWSIFPIMRNANFCQALNNNPRRLLRTRTVPETDPGTQSDSHEPNVSSWSLTLNGLPQVRFRLLDRNPLALRLKSKYFSRNSFVGLFSIALASMHEAACALLGPTIFTIRQIYVIEKITRAEVEMIT